MSPLTLNELRVGLCPDRLVVAQFGQALGRKLVRREICEVAMNPVDTLRQVAAGARVSVVLSNHFVRYAVLPWSSNLGSAREWAAFALHVFIETYGEAAKNWDIRLCTARARAGVASAVDRNLIEALRQVRGVVSIQPHLMAAFNARRARLSPMPGWFVVQERGRLTLALIAGGTWRLIRNRQAAPGWQQCLGEFIEREHATFPDVQADCAAICAEEPLPHTAGRYRLIDLSLPNKFDPGLRPFRMALAA